MTGHQAVRRPLAALRPAALPRGAVRLATILALVVVAGLVLQFARQPLVRSGVLSQPQSYVALAYPNAGSLPKVVATGSRLDLPFQVANYTGGPVDQAWTADLVVTGAPAQLLAQGTVRVPDGQAVTVPLSVVAPAHPALATIQVAAPGRDTAPLRLHLIVAWAGTGSR
jgi:hypothetical protein